MPGLGFSPQAGLFVFHRGELQAKHSSKLWKKNNLRFVQPEIAMLRETMFRNIILRATILRAIVLFASLAVLFVSPVTAQDHDDADTLRVLTWNVLRGGNNVQQGAEKALAVIQAVAPDLVLLQESYDIDGDRPTLGRWLAEQLGWNAYQGESTHLCVLTSLELETTFFHDAWHGVGAKLQDAQGRELLAYSIWIDYRAYITAELRDNPAITDEELLAAESERSSRLPETEALLQFLQEQGHLSANIPLLVGGDWNTPSHLDWTTDTARVFKHRRALPLPVSLAVHKTGLDDTFRMVHVNPVQRPGITWSPMYRTVADGKDQGFERIDRVYLKNPSTGWRLQPTAARVLPEVWEDDAIPAAEREFPSDHGAVLIEMQWLPASASGQVP